MTKARRHEGTKARRHEGTNRLTFCAGSCAQMGDAPVVEDHRLCQKQGNPTSAAAVMGKALLDSYRDKVFLMTKIDGRTKKAATEQINDCLRPLQTDRFDLLQHHEILRMEDPAGVFAPGGSLEAVVEAQKAGKVRFIGFTGHNCRGFRRHPMAGPPRNGILTLREARARAVPAARAARPSPRQPGNP